MSRLNAYIRETPEALRRLLESGSSMEPVVQTVTARKWRKIWIVGSGTSLFAAEIVARIWEEAMAVDAEAMGALPFLEQAETLPIGSDTLVLAISQTGATNVLVEAMEIVGRRGALTLACTAFPESPLAKASMFTLDSLTGVENTPGKTKGFATTTVAAARIALAASGGNWQGPLEGLIAALEQTMVASDALLEGWVERFADTKAIWVVGSGSQVPAAIEGALKLLEVAKLPVIGKELEEMLHGQFHAIGEGCAVILIAGAMTRAQRIADLRRVVDKVGVPALAIADTAAAAATADWSWDLVIDVTAAGSFAPLVGALPLQLLAERLASRRGLDPDQPRYPELYKISGNKSIYARQANK